MPKIQWKAFVTGAMFGGMMLLFVAVLSTTVASLWRKIVPGVRIANLNVGSKTGEEAVALLSTQIKSHPKVATLFYKDQKWQLTGADFELDYDLLTTINQAWLVGRSGSVLDRLSQLNDSLGGKIQIPLVTKYNHDTLETVLASISAQIDDPGVAPALKIEHKNGKNITINPGKNSRVVDQNSLNQQILSAWSNLSAKPIEITFREDHQALTEGQVTDLRSQANRLLDKELVLIVDDNQWKLTDEQLINLLNLNNPQEFDREKLVNLVRNYATGIDRDPQNAAFQFTDGRVVEFRAAKDGLRVNQDKLVSQIQSQLGALIQGNVNIQVTTDRTPPAITTESVNNLGIKELLGKGESTYFHSIPNRVHNVDITAARINGVIVPPGETFSFNQTVGDISQATGYLPAYVIKEGRTVLGDGGGVCQVSTTVFRAALNAGLPILERKAHAYRVGYYEQNAPVGLDATVFGPTVDLKFKNDTPAHLLIQTINDPKKLKLIVEIYGTSDGRKAEIGKTQVWNQVPPPPTLYQDDPTLPVGTLKQVDWSAWGAKTSFTYRVTRNSQVLQDKVFYSNYQPWQAIYLRGTKAN